MLRYYSENGPEHYVPIQKKLIEQAYQMLAEGGELLCSTCTFSVKENEEVIAGLLDAHPDMEVQEITPGYEGFAPGVSVKDVYKRQTYGHLDVILRASKLFDRVIVGVLHNSSKSPLFSVEERVNILRKATQDIPNVEVRSISGLAVDFAKECQAHTIGRGLRAITDFEYELQMAQTNREQMAFGYAARVDVHAFYFNINTPYYSAWGNVFYNLL